MPILDFFSSQSILGRRGISENAPSTACKTLAASSGTRGKIQQRWGKFSDQEIGAIEDNDEPAAQVRAKYSLDNAQAKRDVHAFARGRRL